jgi:hypothetical protein
MDYQKKYLKYKNKYLSLKQKGGKMTYETAPTIMPLCDFYFLTKDQKLFYDIYSGPFTDRFIENTSISYYRKYADKASYIRNLPPSERESMEMIERIIAHADEQARLREEGRKRGRKAERRAKLFHSEDPDMIMTNEEMLELKSEADLYQSDLFEDETEEGFGYGCWNWIKKVNPDGSVVYIPSSKRPCFRE